MLVDFHAHAVERMAERGVTPEEAIVVVDGGVAAPARHGRTSFRRVFPVPGEWMGRRCGAKEIELIATRDGAAWLVITVLARYHRVAEEVRR